MVIEHCAANAPKFSDVPPQGLDVVSHQESQSPQRQWARSSAPYQEFAYRICGSTEHRSGTKNRHYVGGLIGKAGLDGKVDPRIFHHDAAGNNLQGFPMIRWGGGKGWIRIRAVGEEAIDIVSDQIRAILGLIRADIQGPISAYGTIDEVSIQPSDAPIFYTAWNLIYARKSRQFQKFNAMGLEEKKALLANLIARDIEKQCELLNIGLSFTPEIEVTRIGDQVPVRASLGAGASPDSAVKDWASGTVVDFRMFAKLSGSWAAGGLISRGHGHIAYRRPTLEMNDA